MSIEVQSLLLYFKISSNFYILLDVEICNSDRTDLIYLYLTGQNGSIRQINMNIEYLILIYGISYLIEYDSI